MSNPYRMRKLGQGLTEKQLSRLCDCGDVIIKRGEDDPQTFTCTNCLDGMDMEVNEKGIAYGGTLRGTRCRRCHARLSVAKMRAQNEHKEIGV